MDIPDRSRSFCRLLCVLVLSLCVPTEAFASTWSVRRALQRRAASSSSASIKKPLAASVLRPYLVPAKKAAAPAPARRSASSASSVASVSVRTGIDALREEVLLLVNKERAAARLPALTMNRTLQNAAQAYAEDMTKSTLFSHTDPKGRGSLERIRAAGYLTPPCDCAWRYRTGENLGRGQTTPVQVLKDWMKSPLHRKNMLDPGFKEMGIGNVGDIWVQNFGFVERQ